MNLGKLFELQRELDDRIEQQHPVQPGEDRLAKKILALQVELGELANEWRGFKFWSDDQEPRTSVFAPGVADEYNSNPLLEEYVDCLHFILSIGLEIGYESAWVSYPSEGAKNHNFTVESFSNCINLAGLMRVDDYYNQLFQYFLDLGYLLDFTWEQIEQAYLEKNKVNHQRQENGY